MLQSLQNHYEGKINTEFNLYSSGLNPKARLMLEAIRNDATKIADALQVANDEMIKFIYVPKRDDIVQIKIGLMSRCEQVENSCMSVLARIFGNMLNAIAHPLFEPMALDATVAKSVITAAVREHQRTNASGSLQQLFEVGARGVQYMLDDSFSSIKWQLKLSEIFIQPYCRRFMTQNMHSDMRDICRINVSISDSKLRMQRGVFENFNIESINGLTRNNLVNHIFSIFKGGFDDLNELGKLRFSDTQRLIYYLIN